MTFFCKRYTKNSVATKRTTLLKGSKWKWKVSNLTHEFDYYPETLVMTVLSSAKANQTRKVILLQ